jgi:hypothetical protein
MVAGTEGGRIGQSEGVRCGGGVRRGDQEAADADGARSDEPNGTAVAGDGGRGGHAGDAQGGGDGIRGHGVREDGGKAGGDGLNIEGAEVDEEVQGVGGRGRDVDAIGQGEG